VHKQLFNEALFTLILQPEGPLLIKAGEGDSDPTKPDMSFVRTLRNPEADKSGREAQEAETVYLPGSSLKGVLRAHCERLARTVDSEERQQRTGRPLACDPLHNEWSCSQRLEEDKKFSAAQKHKNSCFLCQMFGNTSLGSHLRVADAYPTGDSPRLEERNGVAIDRVFGSVAVGPFNYETVTSGTFKTTLHLRNFSLAQLGLLAIALRDLSLGRVRVGFGKSRGLGIVRGHLEALTIRYPLCQLVSNDLQVLGGKNLGPANQLYGIGVFAEEEYGYPSPDETEMPDGYRYRPDEWGGEDWIGVDVEAPRVEREVDLRPLGVRCVPMWKAVVQHAAG